MKTVGVWDSGVGGLSVLRALLSELPATRFAYVADSAYAPYGARSAESVTERALAIARALQEQEPLDALVVACNTATAGAIEALRRHYPTLPVVGIEPALKPAAQATRSGHVGVLATQGTLHSQRFHALTSRVRQAFPDVVFSCQSCEGLANAIEQGDEVRVRTLCEQAWNALQTPSGKPIDQLVLGCTHYPFAAQVLQALCGPTVALVDPAHAVARQTRRVLDLPLSDRRTAPAQISVRWFATGNPHTLARAAMRWIDPAAAVEHLAA